MWFHPSALLDGMGERNEVHGRTESTARIPVIRTVIAATHTEDHRYDGHDRVKQLRNSKGVALWATPFGRTRWDRGRLLHSARLSSETRQLQGVTNVTPDTVIGSDGKHYPSTCTKAEAPRMEAGEGGCAQSQDPFR